MSERRYELDLTNCQLPEFFENLPKVIIATDGEHDLEFDVISDKTLNEKLRSIAEIQGRMDIPVGFNIHQLPVGGVFRRLPDQE